MWGLGSYILCCVLCRGWVHMQSCPCIKHRGALIPKSTKRRCNQPLMEEKEGPLMEEKGPLMEEEDCGRHGGAEKPIVHSSHIQNLKPL